MKARARDAEHRRSRTVWSIRWIATTLAVVLTAAGVLSVGALSERHARSALRREIEARLQLQVRNLALSSSSALLEDYPELTLHPLVRSMCVQEPELELAVVVDHRGIVQGHADARKIGTRFAPPPGLGLEPGSGVVTQSDLLRPAASLLIAATPVRHPDGHVIGAAYVGLPLRYIDQAVQSSRRQQAMLLAILVVLGAGAALLLMSQLLRPVGALRSGLERIGRGDLETPIEVRDRTELGLLAETVNDMAHALRNAQAEMVERERLAHELELARDIQRSLLPSEVVTSGLFQVRGDQRAAAEVGGDYWDVLHLSEGRLGLAIADVAGKGLGGCLVMSMLSALLRADRATHVSPAAVLAKLDDQLSESLRPGVFVTICYSILDPVTGRLTFASAGHNPLLLWRKRSGALEMRPSRAIPLGAVRGAVRGSLHDEVLTIEPGDVCVMFTDGYTEAFGPDGEEVFGMTRLQEIVARSAPQGGEAVLGALREAVREWSGNGTPSDDETLLVLSHQGRASQGDEWPGLMAEGDRMALAQLEHAEVTGPALELQTHLDGLRALDPWLRGLSDAMGIPDARHEVVRSALYEALANIAEHGHAEREEGRVQVWWLPDADGPHMGSFVIRDDGKPFRPATRPPTNFRDSAVRRRGRGLGLEIMHRALAAVSYHPGTPRGNITLLTLGRATGRLIKENVA
jgi:serine phosphatase RsbU (regulator of sigma subunit)/anti-sigma regulatory factor (Ser/Thr protein kinase)